MALRKPDYFSLVKHQFNFCPNAQLAITKNSIKVLTLMTNFFTKLEFF